MKTVGAVAALVALALTAQSHAYNASSSNYVVGVQVHFGVDGLQSLITQTALPGCGSTQMAVQSGGNAGGWRSLLDVAMAAQLSGKRVEFYYNTGSFCSIEYLRLVDY